MNKSMLIGVVAGIGVATAGGVLGYQFMGAPQVETQGSNVAVEAPAAVASRAPTGSALVVARAEPKPTPAPVAAAPAAPKPRATTQAAPRAPAPAPVAAVPAEECWDEEVTVAVEPKDEHRIAGTAIGAVVGGAIGNEVSDRDMSQAAGAAAGAFIGRKLQKRMQENRAETRTVTTIERRCGPVGSR